MYWAIVGKVILYSELISIYLMVYDDLLGN